MLREAVHGILYNTANSLAMNGIEGGESPNAGKVQHGLPIYKIAMWIFDAIIGLIVLIGAIKVYSKCRMTEEQFQNRKRMTKKGKMIMWIVIAVLVVIIAIVFYIWAWPLLEKAFKI